MTSSTKMIVTLFVVALVCAVVLSFVYAYTTPKIAAMQQTITIQGLKEVIAAAEFVPVVPDTLWSARDSLGHDVGKVFRVFPRGYGGPIPITVGVGDDGTITGVRVAGASEGLKETPGLGTKVAEPTFTRQFVGKAGDAVLLKNDGGTIDAITAATISSRAVCTGVRKGLEQYASGAPQDDSLALWRGLAPVGCDLVAILPGVLWAAVSGGDTIGVVFRSAEMGFSDSIVVLVGMERGRRITGVRVLRSAESEPMDERIRAVEFLDAFESGIPDAISGATVSSRALIRAVQKGVERFGDRLP